MTQITARRLPRQTGPAGWNAILPAAPPARPIDADATADIVIIGAGFAGLSAARRLLQLRPDIRIVMLEAGRAGEGAAGRNSGFMIDLPHDLQSDDYAGHGGGDNDRLMTRLNRSAIAFAAAAVQEYGIAPAYFDPAGKVNGAAGEHAHAANLSYARHLASLNEPHDMLDARAMREMTGSDYYHSGLYTPGTAMLQPAGYIRGLASGLAARMTLHEDSPVTAIDRRGPDWSVTSNGHTVTAPQVIMATNGHIESFGFARGRLMHVILFASMTQDLDPGTLATLGGASRWGITPSDPMGTTMRRIDTAQGGNRIITRTCTEFRPGMEASRAGFARAARRMRENFAARFPALSGVGQEYVWAGHLCLSLNNVSVTGALDDGLYSACVQNGLGTARGTLTGIAAAEAACGHKSDISRRFTTEPAPKRLPPEPVATLGANMVLRWKEHRARKE